MPEIGAVEFVVDGGDRQHERRLQGQHRRDVQRQGRSTTEASGEAGRSYSAGATLDDQTSELVLRQARIALAGSLYVRDDERPERAMAPNSSSSRRPASSEGPSSALLPRPSTVMRAPWHPSSAESITTDAPMASVCTQAATTTA